jgi:DNA-binding transcriptional ArsR family regulator
MYNLQFEPIPLHEIIEEDQIRGYIHPTRMILLQMLSKEKRTISSIARELGVHPANITHHFKLLEKIGLIRLVEKRDTGKNLAKYYRAIAYTFAINPNDHDGTNKNALALSILKNDLSVAINTAQKENNNKKIIALLATAKIGLKQLRQFTDKLNNLIKDFQACDSKDGAVYNINLSLYPNDVNCIVQKEQKVEIK